MKPPLTEPKVLVKNSGDPEQVHAAERKEEDRATRDKMDIAFLVEQPEFGRWLWRILQNCGVEDSPMSVDPYRSYFAMGQQSVGIAITKEIDRVDPDFISDIRAMVKREERDGR